MFDEATMQAVQGGHSRQMRKAKRSEALRAEAEAAFTNAKPLPAEMKHDKRAGFTTNKSHGASKARRLMAKASRRRNRV